MSHARVLLVDDDEEFVSALAERLCLRNYDAAIATSGQAALSEIQKKCPDIVLLDYKMPGMNGMETLKRITTNDSSIDVIIVTGSLDADIGESAMSAGATDYMVKPLDVEELLGKLENIRQKRGLG
jgi:DNA-binding response OmpR family regulator